MEKLERKVKLAEANLVSNALNKRIKVKRTLLTLDESLDFVSIFEYIHSVK